MRRLAERTFVDGAGGNDHGLVGLAGRQEGGRLQIEALGAQLCEFPSPPLEPLPLVAGEEGLHEQLGRLRRQPTGSLGRSVGQGLAGLGQRGRGVVDVDRRPVAEDQLPAALGGADHRAARPATGEHGPQPPDHAPQRRPPRRRQPIVPHGVAQLGRGHGPPSQREHGQRDPRLSGADVDLAPTGTVDHDLADQPNVHAPLCLARADPIGPPALRRDYGPTATVQPAGQTS